MVWGYITFKGVRKISWIKGNINSEAYCRIIEDDFLLHLADQSTNEFEGSNFILVQDNTPCNASKVMKNYFSEQNIITCD